MSAIPTFHDLTTIGDRNATATTSTDASNTHQDISSKTHNISNISNISNTSNTHQDNLTNTGDNHVKLHEPDTISAAPVVPRDRLNSEYEPTREITEPSGSLSSTTGPFQVPTTDDISKSDAPLTSSVGQQSAPGKAGSIGDKALSAMGYGGSKVERPKEDQGLGEKIINFLGA